MERRAGGPVAGGRSGSIRIGQAAPTSGPQKRAACPGIHGGVHSAGRRSRLFDTEPLHPHEAGRTADSSEPSSCCLNSWLAVAAGSPPRKATSIKGLHPRSGKPARPHAVRSRRRWMHSICEGQRSVQTHDLNVRADRVRIPVAALSAARLWMLHPAFHGNGDAALAKSHQPCIRVPAPRWVSSSSRTACSTLPSRMTTASTPASSA
jgi:hypothetical protein